jgi:hypothetical protein
MGMSVPERILLTVDGARMDRDISDQLARARSAQSPDLLIDLLWVAHMFRGDARFPRATEWTEKLPSAIKKIHAIEQADLSQLTYSEKKQMLQDAIDIQNVKRGVLMDFNQLSGVAVEEIETRYATEHGGKPTDEEKRRILHDTYGI